MLNLHWENGLEMSIGNTRKTGDTNMLEFYPFNYGPN